MDNLWINYPEIQKDLFTVKSIIESNGKCKNKVVETAILELVHSGGKMLRPAFVLLAGHFGTYSTQKLAPLGAVIDMLHMATLVHDDIIDDAKLRRGKETVQFKYGKNYAVYIGDFLFCKCFKILAENSSLQSINIDSNSMAKICIGELGQYSAQFKTNVSVKKYLKRIAAKTAELFALSFLTGAEGAECSKSLLKTLGKIGYNIGMAFQIIDDILDYTSKESIMGKPIAHDLRQGIFTLPLIYAIEKQGRSLQELLEVPPYSEERIATILTLVHTSKGIEKSRVLAEKYTKKAFSLIESLPQGESRKILYNITQTLLSRKY